MNGANSLQPDNGAPDLLSGGYGSVKRTTGRMPRAVAHADNGTAADIRLERLQQYVAHLEGLLLHKNNEVNELRSEMEAHTVTVRQQQREQEGVLMHQARYAAMGELLGTIAHQWRQPLNVISLTVQNMRDAWDYGEFTGELLESSVIQAMEQIMMLSRTIDDFRSFLNPLSTTEVFNPLQCLEEIAGLLSGWLSSYPLVDIQVSGNREHAAVAVITGSKDAFTQVLLNLLSNANDAVRQQQRRSGTKFQGHISIRLRINTADAVISVADNGGGIAEPLLARIFEPYFTTKNTTDGIGTGLYVSRIIVENSLKGELWAENISEGALFCIRLPLAQADGGGE